MPVLQVARLEHPADQAQELLVLHSSGEQRKQARVIEAAEAVPKVCLDQPHRAVPGLLDLGERRQARPARPEAEAAVAEDGLVDPLQDQPAGSLDQLVIRSGDAEWPFAAVGLWDVDASRRGE